MNETFLNGKVTLYAGDSRDVLKTIADCSIDSIVCDPPYALVSIGKRFGAENAHLPNKGGPTANVYNRTAKGFMGKVWDTGETAFATEFWQECLQVLKPGGHVVAFSGTRTYHRMACAIEDAGFEIRDQLQWLYGSGFPKSHDVSKGIDRAAGAEREIVGQRKKLESYGPNEVYGDGPDHGGVQLITAPATDAAREWQGWGTALKPAQEPICLARKPLAEGTVAANVLRWGTGAINVDGCRVELREGDDPRLGGKGDWSSDKMAKNVYEGGYAGIRVGSSEKGRWPANVITDGSDEVVGMFPDTTSGTLTPDMNVKASTGWSGGSQADRVKNNFQANEGSAARFFYTAKADSLDRAGSRHPTVKPVDLMQWLVRLVTPRGGLVLDPFAGTGTTAEACFREGMNCVLIEREAEYQADIRRRMRLVLSGPDERARESIKARLGDARPDHGPLFGVLSEAAE